MSSTDVTTTLEELARNFRWVWDEDTQELFRAIDPQLWECRRTPLEVLGAASPQRLAELAADPGFQARLAAARAGLREYLTGTPAAPEVAYFCMEHGVAPALRNYAGGLGMLAGCIEKTASDLGVPMVAVGLMYHWYLRQRLSYGWQHEDWLRFDPAGAGLSPCPDVEVSVDLAGVPVAVRVWRARVGRVDLYLLDTDLPANPPHLRDVTDRLYAGDKEHRLHQEMILGIGGVRVLRALGLRPTVFHANEGHAGFCALERVRELVRSGVRRADAMARVRAATIFTTHTAVAAGFDLFDRELMEKYFSAWAAECDMDLDELMALGHFPGQNPDDAFNMAVLCAHMSEQVNAVSKLHREVTEERVLGRLWPGRSAPVTAVTNGVHPKTWTPPAMAALYRRYVGVDWDYASPRQWERVWDIPDRDLWTARQELRAGMVEFVRGYLPSRLAEQGWTDDLSWAGEVLDPDALTIVVARRAAEYKETDLLVSQPDRLRALVGDPARPVQLIFAGQAHPADGGGKERIRNIVNFSLGAEVRSRVVFLPGYDMRLAMALLAGADVWLNHPRRGDEACGTSFMKSVFAGGRLMTTADGGADEMVVDGRNGWIIGDRSYHAHRDVLANNAFGLLENVIVPEFHDRGGCGLPHRWIDGIKDSLADLAWRVGSGGMMREYHRMYRYARRRVRSFG